MTDEQLVARAQAGDGRALAAVTARHDRMATGIASQFFIPGATFDDVRQEARVGLVRAVSSFKPEIGVSFKTLARLAITRQVVTALKMSQAAKHSPLNESVRQAHDERGDLDQIIDLLPIGGSDPHEIVERREEIRELGRALRVDLTAREAQTLILFANDCSYDEIVRITGLKDRKAVDNSISRARAKLAGELGSHARKAYVCPSCGHETVRKPGLRNRPGRPPLCNVCATRKAAA